MKTSEKKKGMHLLIGAAAGLALSLCAFEYGRPIGHAMYKYTGDHIDDWVEVEEMPVTMRKVPPPPEMPRPKPNPTVIAMVNPASIQVVDDRSDLPDLPVFNFDDVDFFGVESVEVDSTPFIIVEEHPAFPGGESALFKYLADNLNYPRLAKHDNRQGIVYVSFVVDRDGSIRERSIEILRSPHEALSNEAIRVVKNMPNWVPGKQRGKPVPVQYRLPIRFTIR